MLNESLNQFKFDSTRFQRAFNIFYTFNNIERPVQTPQTLIWFNNCVKSMFKQMLNRLIGA